MLCLFGRGSWLPLSSLLNDQNVILAVFIAYSNEYGFAFAPDDYIFFFVNSDASSSDDRDGAIVGSFSYAINDVGKLVSVSACVARGFDSCGNRSRVTCFALHVLPSATPTRFLDERKMGISSSFLFFFAT